MLNLRTALLITLSILLVLVLAKRFKRNVLATDMPAPSHAELIGLSVLYHPSRLHVVLQVPGDQLITLGIKDHDHRDLHAWEPVKMSKGEHAIEHVLPALSDGPYFLEMSTTTQRTVRQFRLQQV